MKNITVSVDDETYRLSRIKAAENGTSVSALVRNFLKNLAHDDDKAVSAKEPASETNLEQRHRILREVAADFEQRGIGLQMTDNLPREELYHRNAIR